MKYFKYKRQKQQQQYLNLFCKKKTRNLHPFFQIHHHITFDMNLTRNNKTSINKKKAASKL